MDQWRAVMPASYAAGDMIFVVGGFDNGEPYGTVLEFYVPSRPDPVVKHAPGAFGMVGAAASMLGSRRERRRRSSSTPTRSVRT